MDVAAAAAQLGVAPKTLYKWVEHGVVPVIKIGRLVRFRRDDLEEWVERRMLPALAPHSSNEIRKVK